MKLPIQPFSQTAAATLSLFLLVLHHPQTAVSAAVNTPQPIQPGSLPNCQGFRVASPGDTCWGMANTLGISLDAFLALNPQLGGARGCAKNLLAGTNYCVHTLDAPPPAPSTKPPPPPPPSTKTKAPPAPTTKKTTITPPPPPPPPTTTAPPDCPVNNCWRGFVVATSGAAAAQSSFCKSYLGGVNTETDKENLAGLPAFPKASCGVPAELSTYCSCWNAGVLTPAVH